MDSQSSRYRICDELPFDRPVMSRSKALVTSCVIAFCVISIIEAISNPRLRGKLVTNGYQRSADIIRLINDL